jgi:hypothetical protein
VGPLSDAEPGDGSTTSTLTDAAATVRCAQIAEHSSVKVAHISAWKDIEVARINADAAIAVARVNAHAARSSGWKQLAGVVVGAILGGIFAAHAAGRPGPTPSTSSPDVPAPAAPCRHQGDPPTDYQSIQPCRVPSRVSDRLTADLNRMAIAYQMRAGEDAIAV